MTREEIRKHISIIEDHDEDETNPARYYCQVYTDEEQTIEWDYFCIRQNDVEDIDNFSQVEDFAIDNMKNYLPDIVKKSEV